MLAVTNLSCTRGERLLFSNVNFSLAAGRCLHVQGDNGSGKTSLMRLLVGLSPLEAGEIRWCDKAVAESGMREDMTYLGHHAAVNGDLTALENLHFAAVQDGVQLDAAAGRAALGKMGLRGREDLPVRVLSAGQKRRVLLARLLVRPTKLWVLDEAFNALDVGAVGVLNELISAHLQSGGVAVLTSHQPLTLSGVQVLAL
jgi:heme exporter protein A